MTFPLTQAVHVDRYGIVTWQTWFCHRASCHGQLCCTRPKENQVKITLKVWHITQPLQGGRDKMPQTMEISCDIKGNVGQRERFRQQIRIARNDMQQNSLWYEFYLPGTSRLIKLSASAVDLSCFSVWDSRTTHTEIYPRKTAERTGTGSEPEGMKK